MMIYEDVITSVIPPIKHESEYVYPLLSSIKLNMRYDKLIPNIRDDPVLRSTKHTLNKVKLFVVKKIFPQRNQ
jgi:hypothetical protein